VRKLIRRPVALAALFLTAALVPLANADLIVNPGFDGPEVLVLGDVTRNPITNDPAGTWLLGGNDDADRWEIVGGAVAGNQPGGEAQGLVQWIQDNQTSQGPWLLNFDFLMQSPSSGDYDLLLYVFGWNAGDNAPGVDYENGTVETGDSFIPDDSVNLITDPVGSEGMLRLANNGAASFPGVVDDGAFHRISVHVDFGGGYDYIGVLFYGENGGSDGLLQLDDVDFVVPEPATLSLLGLSALGLLARRRRR